MTITDEVELIAEAVYRRAKRTWHCTCDPEILGWQARAYGPHGGSTWGRFDTELQALAAAIAKIGTPSNYDMREGSPNYGEPSGHYIGGEAVPLLNRNFSSRSEDCAGVINPGDRYVEYLGEAHPFQSGIRYCLACGVTTWNMASRY